MVAVEIPLLKKHTVNDSSESNDLSNCNNPSVTTSLSRLAMTKRFLTRKRAAQNDEADRTNKRVSPSQAHPGMSGILSASLRSAN